MAERNPKIAVYRVLNVIRRCAIFQVALGFAQLLPSQFARIPGQRFQPSAEGTIENSLALVQRIAKAVSSKLQDTRARSAEVSFSVKISGKGKFIVAEAAGEAHLQVKLTLDTGGHQSTGT